MTTVLGALLAFSITSALLFLAGWGREITAREEVEKQRGHMAGEILELEAEFDALLERHRELGENATALAALLERSAANSELSPLETCFKIPLAILSVLWRNSTHEQNAKRVQNLRH